MDIAGWKQGFRDRPVSVVRFFVDHFSEMFRIAKRDEQRGSAEAGSAKPTEGVLGFRRFVLSERDAKRVLEMLENPPEPTPALMAAVRRMRQRKSAAL